MHDKLSSRYPEGLEKIANPKNLCCRRGGSQCSSTRFSTRGIPFTKVCGRIVGIQYYSVKAFDPYYTHQTRMLDDLYVDGVSITYGSEPRQHIWTFAAALDEDPAHSSKACPCTNSKSNVPFTGLIPEFIGEDFYCETGSRTAASPQYYLDDPAC